MFEFTAHPFAGPKRLTGVTLIELLVTIALLGILAALAVPGFADVLRRQSVESMREEMVASLGLARVEAISRGQNVVLLRTAPCAQAETALDWDCGWTVFADLDGDGAIDVNEPTLHTVQGKPGTRIRRSPVASFLTVNRFGRIPFGRIEIFPAAAGFDAADGVLLCVSGGGRMRAERGELACAP
jgi:type IV fimbrial biogenesis protein FimT